MKLIECVPNFSEGRDRSIIDAITAEISGTEGAQLLDVDPGAATNRTVVTLAGPPDAAVEAAFRAIRRASELIDMSQHQGEHARMGATDVCPFVPMQGATMQDCVELANRLGERLHVPVGIVVVQIDNIRAATPVQGFARTPQLKDIATRVDRWYPSTKCGAEAYADWLLRTKTWAVFKRPDMPVCVLQQPLPGQAHSGLRT